MPTAPPVRSDFSPRARTLLLLAFLALVLARLPRVALEGRFYAEEGPFFFAYAWHMPWRDALLHTLGGYLNIVASAATLADARLVQGGYLPLEHAPCFTQAVALAFQAVPAILVLTARAQWLAGRWQRLAALAIMATAPLAEQTWLHTLHSQFHLALATGIILAIEAEAGVATAVFRLAVLFLAPLCGPAAIVLAPLLFVRAALERTRPRIAQALAIGLGAAVQLGFFYVGSKTRGISIDAATLSAVLFIRHVVAPLFGPSAALHYAEAARAAFKAGGTPWSAVLLGAAGVLAALAFAAMRRGKPEMWLIVAGLGLAVVSYVGGIRSGPLLLDPAFATRYAFVPECLFAFAALAASQEFHYARWLTIWLVAIGCVAFPFPQAELADGPDWRAEVAAWRRDVNHRLAVWPKGWLVDLSPTDRRCTSDPNEPDPPDFCDQYWEKL